MADFNANDIPNEGDKLEIDQALDRLASKEDTTASESQPENKETAKPSQGGEHTPEEKPEPFHKHPRWIKTQQELKEARDKVIALEAAQNQSKPAVLPEWYKNRFGETEDSIKNYAEIVKGGGELEWLKEQVKEDLKREQEAEQSQAKAGEEYVDTQIAEMADEGLKFDRNALLKFMVDFQEEYGSGALLDPEGNYDFRKSLNLMNKLQPAEEVVTPNKQAAAQAGRSRTGAPKSSTIPVVNSRALRRGNWRDADTGQFVSQ